jgi:phosphatidate cytidylyltransferase
VVVLYFAFCYQFSLLVGVLRTDAPDKSWIEKYLGVIAGSIIFCMFVFIIRGTLSLSWFYHLIPVFMLMFIIKLYENTKSEFDTLAYQLFGIMYICFPLVMLADLSYFNSVDYSFALPMGFFILQWGSDTGAYLAGKQFGKHKLFERISPKKTWEGGIGALVINLAIAYGLSRLWDDVSTIDWLIISSIIVVFGTFGDLFESLLKRNFRNKRFWQ